MSRPTMWLQFRGPVQNPSEPMLKTDSLQPALSRSHCRLSATKLMLTESPQWLPILEAGSVVGKFSSSV